MRCSCDNSDGKERQNYLCHVSEKLLNGSSIYHLTMYWAKAAKTRWLLVVVEKTQCALAAGRSQQLS